MKKTNNKGFSLVELIVVIAIMAVLIAVLAPSFIRYVEKSRNSTDMQNAASIVTAVQVWAVDVSAEVGRNALTSGTYVVTVDGTGVSFSGDGANAQTALQAAFDNSGLSTTTKCASRQEWTSYTITFTVASNGTLQVTYNPAALGNSTGSTT